MDIHQCLSIGNIEYILQNLKKCNFILEKDRFGDTVFHKKDIYDYGILMDIIKFYGGKVFCQTNRYGKNVMMYMAYENHNEYIKYFLEFHTKDFINIFLSLDSIYFRDVYGNNLVHYSTNNGYMIEKIIEYNPNMLYTLNDLNENVLHISRNVDVLNILNENIDLNKLFFQKNKYDIYPIFNVYKHTLQFYLEKFGKDVLYIKDDKNKTLFGVACYTFDLDAIKIILSIENNMILNIETMYEMFNRYHLYKDIEKLYAILKIIFEKCDTSNIFEEKDNEGNILMHYVLYTNNIDIFKLLYKYNKESIYTKNIKGLCVYDYYTNGEECDIKKFLEKI